MEGLPSWRSCGSSFEVGHAKEYQRVGSLCTRRDEGRAVTEEVIKQELHNDVRVEPALSPLEAERSTQQNDRLH